MIGQLDGLLRRSRNPDGGWGYYAGKASRLEPTCWALLALQDADPHVLRNWPADDGLLLERAGGQSNYAFHGLALLTLLARKVAHQAGNDILLSGIQRVKGVALEQSEHNRQNNSLQGWSWIEGTFSWVEPTAWCLMALKKWARAGGVATDGKRIADAEALLVDRYCQTGGWNHGNSNVFGKELRAYVPTTAIALLALQDRARESVVILSLQHLIEVVESEQSSMAQSLTLLALDVFGASIDSVEARLVEQAPMSIAMRHNLAMAMALVALRRDRGHAAFRM